MLAAGEAGPDLWEATMKTPDSQDQWPHLEDNDPPLDVSREQAAYQRERERLVRDHLGKIALLRFDEVVGVFDTLDDALEEGHRRFGWGRMIFHQISECDELEWVSNVDITHPSVRRLD
jgi:hypothetical protein